MAVTLDSRGNGDGVVHLLRSDPELGETLSASSRASLETGLLVPAAQISAGRWTVGPSRPAGVLGLLVLDGLVLRRIESDGGVHAQLLGPEDLFDPWSSGMISEWLVLKPARIVLLGEQVSAAAGRHPDLLGTLLRRQFRSAERQAAIAALVQRPRIEERLLGFFSAIAGCWGTVSSEGLVIDMPLTHQMLGELIGARRPTITLALGRLDGEGLLQHTTGGPWLLPWSPAGAARNGVS